MADYLVSKSTQYNKIVKALHTNIFNIFQLTGIENLMYDTLIYLKNSASRQYNKFLKIISYKDI